MIVALWDRAKLAEDSGVSDSGGWGGVTLAYNVRSPAEVDAVIVEARAAGARIAREGAQTFWGGYSGAFVDPDGHPWEVAQPALADRRRRVGDARRLTRPRCADSARQFSAEDEPDVPGVARSGARRGTDFPAGTPARRTP
jgi:hypothetical protein